MEKFCFELQRFSTVHGTSDSDYLTSDSTNSFVYGYGGNDTIYNAYNSVTIVGGEDNDSIKSGHNYFDSVDNRIDNPTTDNVSIDSGAGDDYITLNGGNSTVSAGEGDDIILSYHEGNYLNGGLGNDSIHNFSNHATLIGESGNDSLGNSGTNVEIISGDGNDTIHNIGSSTYIYSGAEEDYISTSNASTVTVDGGTGNDTILVGANNNGLVYGGAGDDSIYIYANTSNVTVNGGSGNDTIGLSSQAAAFVQFSPGNGNDVVYGFNENDTLIIDDSFSQYTSDNNVIISTSNGTMNLVDANGKSLNISTGKVTLPLTNIETTLTGTSERDIFTYSGDTKTTVVNFSAGVEATSDVLVLNGGSISGISREAENILITMSDGNYLAVQTSSSSSDDLIQYSGDGASLYSAKIADDSTTTLTYYEGANYYQLNQKGTLLVNDSASNNIWLDGSTGKVFFNVTDINASSAIGANTLAGNGESNLLVGSAGITSLWGGLGFVSDTLIGGSGNDVFFFGKNDGTDTIFNASSNDTVRLYDVNLTDIISADVSDNVVSAILSTGGTLQISGTDSLSPTFRLADSAYKYNYSSGSWQTT